MPTTPSSIVKGLEGGGFSAAYKNKRYEGEAQTDTTSRLIPAIDVFSERGPRSARGLDGGVSARGSQLSSARGDYGYSLIRSDLEDEEGGRIKAGELPGMPHHALGMRQRTMNNMVTHHHGKNNDDAGPLAFVDAGWFEKGLLCFFCLELIARIAHHGCEFFQNEEDWAWNFFDLFIVLVGTFDQWMVPSLVHFDVVSGNLGGDDARAGIFFGMVKVLRYLRIVRLFRLVRIVRPLYELAQGVLEALQGMFWVLVFMVMTLYTVAILCTRMIGHGDILSDELKADPEIREIQAMFTSVQDSMFTLFGTMSSWSLLKFVPLFQESPALKPIFVLFYVYSAWAIVAVMTGVVSENMIAIREQMQKEDEQREEMRKTMISNMLLELFRDVDVDRSGTVSRMEFDAMLRSTVLVQKITKNTHLKVQDLQDLFDWLDHDGGGTITIDEFMTGFKWVNEPLRAKSLVKLEERLATDFKDLENTLKSNSERRTGEVQKLVCAPLRKVHAIAEQMQSLDVQLRDMRDSLRDLIENAPSVECVQDTDARLNAKMDRVFKRLSDLGIQE